MNDITPSHAPPATRTLIVSDHDVARLLPMPACIETMSQTLATLARGEALLPLRTVMRLPGHSAFALMPAMLHAPPALGAKIITVFPGNDATPLDSHIGVVLLFDPHDGRLLAIIDASSVTAIRTAAVSGVATRLLARPDAGDLAILGAGVQAATHLDAMCAVRGIRRVRIWTRNAARARAFVARAARRGAPPVEICASAREAVLGADIVCTTTAAREPVLAGEWLAPGAHVNAVGSSVASARELDSHAVVRSRLWVDRRESALNEAGDFLIPRGEGLIGDAHIIGEIGELILDPARVPGRTSPTEITLFKSLGLAVEDVAAAHLIHERAVAEGAGTWMHLGGLREVESS